MNIYYIGWTQSDLFGLSAVVIAANEKDALEEIDLDASYNSEIRVVLIGVCTICTDGAKTAHVVCRESL